jgi:hypothetical protein
MARRLCMNHMEMEMENTGGWLGDGMTDCGLGLVWGRNGLYRDLSTAKGLNRTSAQAGSHFQQQI